MNPLRALSEPHALFCAPSTRRAGTAPAGEGLSNGIDPGAEGFGKHLRQAHEAHMRPHGPDHDVLHAAARQVAQLAPPAASLPPPAPQARESSGLATPISVEELWPTLVRRAAWSGDARRGSVRLELGAGTLAGATVLVQSDDGRVCVQLMAPAGVDLDAWRARIALRLAARGLDVERVEVD